MFTLLLPEVSTTPGRDQRPVQRPKDSWSSRHLNVVGEDEWLSSLPRSFQGFSSSYCGTAVESVTTSEPETLSLWPLPKTDSFGRGSHEKLRKNRESKITKDTKGLSRLLEI